MQLSVQYNKTKYLLEIESKLFNFNFKACPTFFLKGKNEVLQNATEMNI